MSGQKRKIMGATVGTPTSTSRIARDLEPQIRQYENNTFSNALKGYATGEIISVNDISPTEHNIGCMVKSRNILNITKYYGTTSTSGGIEYKFGNDGTVVANGTANGPSSVVLSGSKSLYQVGKKYRVVNNGKNRVIVAYKDETGTTKYASGRFEWKEGYTHVQTYIQFYSGNVADNETITPMVMEYENEEEPAFTPYVDVTGVKVRKCGENLYVEPTEYAVNADGSVDGVDSIYPTTILSTDTSGAIISVEYNRDLNKAFAEVVNAIIALGGNV